MRPEFNEREFELSVNSEFFHNKNLLVINYEIPTLRQEAKEGYDAKFTFKLRGSFKSLFLQYKISDFVKRPRGEFYKAAQRVGTPFYRFALRCTSGAPQHQTLVALENRGENVFYCAPCFHDRRSLLRYTACKNVLSNVSFLSPRLINIPLDDKPHHVVYDLTGRRTHYMSNLREYGPTINLEGLFDEAIERENFSRYVQALRAKIAMFADTKIDEKRYADDGVSNSEIAETAQIIERIGLAWLIFPREPVTLDL